MKFRDHTPSRRSNPKRCADYHAYKNILKEDFHSRCGYCDNYDRFSDVPYQIDHFVPRTAIKTIADNDYNNLVYSCRRCNRAKWDKWPTGNEFTHNNGSEGFIDPCDPLYAEQFERNERGEIVSVTTLGDWMWKELNLGNPAHRIIWMLTQLRKEMEEIRSKSQASGDSRLIELFNMYTDLEDKLRGTPQL